MLTALFLIGAVLLVQPPAAPADPAPLPTHTLTSDDTKIDHSCRIEIGAGTVIQDANNNGVVQITADGITVEFADGSTLRGANPGAAPDAMTGIGIRLDGHKNVTIRGGTISGFKIGLLATKSPGLTLDSTRFDDNFRQHLRSTTQAEDESDWLWPHKNDAHEWRTNYGAAACIESSAGVSIRKLTVRRGQNGVILDRVTGSRVYDCDLSFLSGWGLAMWRSSGNLISRNAIDFCVRGYSHGVYNRGQDSAGILMFEQCSGNIIVENSVTHGGDGLFGFAGREAIGEDPPPAPDFSYERRGCNDNLIARNDFSNSPAHGLELTFSQGNRIVANLFSHNAICGIWGGYSSGTLIAENRFEANGEMGYGLERGGVNIEHGSSNLIVGNTFTGDKCGVHMWWGESDLLKKPWGIANEKGVSDNVIAGNSFKDVPVVLHLRDLSKAHDKVRGTVFAANKLENCPKPLDATEGVVVTTEGEEPMYVVPEIKAIGETSPVAARDALGGREAILMTEWGPWDHASPLVRKVSSTSAGDTFAVLGAKVFEFSPPTGYAQVARLPGEPGESGRFTISTVPGRITHYSVTVKADGESQTVTGTLVAAPWNLKVFPWPADPRENRDAWRQGASAKDAVTLSWSGPLSLPLGQRGPKGIPAWKDVKDKLPGPAKYGIIATTDVQIPKGTWRVVTRSDDGVRVMINRGGGAAPGGGQILIDNWTWHGPTRDTAQFVQDAEGPATLTVEYFQIDGFAVLELTLEPLK